MSEELNCTPPEIREIARNVAISIIPDKSQHLYEKQYKKFTTNISENVLLAYFQLQSTTYKPSTLWATYSMLRSCWNLYKHVHILQYQKLQGLLKRASVGYTPTRSKILEEDHINTFIKEANDSTHLAMKVILIIGYNGASRREELTKLRVEDLVIKSDRIIVSIPKTKNYIPRTFAITDKTWMELIKKYLNLRPTHVTNNRFFLTYRSGYCINSPIGINMMGKISKHIATYLKLPNPELYRRSSATHVASCGGDLLTLKRHEGWNSSSVAEGYVHSSVQNKINISKMFVSERNETEQPGCSKNIPSTITNISQNITNTECDDSETNKTYPGHNKCE
ncbi:hypothetical protein FQR65_LT14184 [Abscondita terminalis]|nr:hypothetical protein FQR65_LT14184 [Abscondita terminalis]